VDHTCHTFESGVNMDNQEINGNFIFARTHMTDVAAHIVSPHSANRPKRIDRFGDCNEDREMFVPGRGARDLLRWPLSRLSPCLV